MTLDETYSELLGDLYEGPLEEPPWQTFLANVRTLLGAHLVTLLLRPPSQHDQAVMLADGGSLEAIKSYNEGQFVLDPFVDLPCREVVTLQEYLCSEQLLASEFYHIIMEPQGWYDFLGLDIREEGELDVRFRVGRYRGAAAFGEQEKALVYTLLPHLERSIRLQARISRIERERAVYAGAVEQLQVATIILDEHKQVLSTNAYAQQLLGAGIGASMKDNRLQLEDKQANEELAELLDAVKLARVEADSLAARAMQVPKGDGSGDLGLILRSLPASEGVEGRGSPSFALFLSDPQHAAYPPQQIIARLFSLTPTEANLAMLLANGLTLDEAAAESSVSRNTARTHLRAVFAKTGVSRQSGLVRLILSSVAPLAGAESD